MPTWFRVILAGAGGLALSGCFSSDTPLLAASEYVQPIQPGLWEKLVPASAEEWAKLSEEQKRDMHCRQIQGANYCAQRVAVSKRTDGSYELRYEDEDGPEVVSVAALAADRFIIQQSDDGTKSYYGFGTIVSPEKFEIRLPDCERDEELHPYAAPLRGNLAECLVPDRARLTQLFAKFAEQAPAVAPQTYLKVAD